MRDLTEDQYEPIVRRLAVQFANRAGKRPTEITFKEIEGGTAPRITVPISRYVAVDYRAGHVPRSEGYAEIPVELRVRLDHVGLSDLILCPELGDRLIDGIANLVEEIGAIAREEARVRHGLKEEDR
jgi:hypothetical protein